MPKAVEQLSFEELFSQSVGHFLNHEYRESAMACSRLLKQVPDNSRKATILCNRASSYFMLQEFEQVVEDANEALQFDPLNLRGLLLKAQALKSLRDIKGAFETLERHSLMFSDFSLHVEADMILKSYLSSSRIMIKEAPEESFSMESKKVDLKFSKDEQKLSFLSKFKEYEVLFNGSSVMLSRAFTFVNSKQFTNAIKIFDRILSIDSKNCRALLGRGTSFSLIGEYNKVKLLS
jgi:tetratricopeptide (TPR) repeat protein